MEICVSAVLRLVDFSIQKKKQYYTGTVEQKESIRG